MLCIHSIRTSYATGSKHHSKKQISSCLSTSPPLIDVHVPSTSRYSVGKKPKKQICFGAKLHMDLYQNCRSLRTKLSLFKSDVSVFNYIFICLTETWLTNSFYDAELCLHNYVVFRCDRSSLSNSFSRGGGVLVATMWSIT